MARSYAGAARHESVRRLACGTALHRLCFTLRRAARPSRSRTREESEPMDGAALERAVGEFWQARERGVYFPDAWRDRLEQDDAYRIQLALVDRRCTGGITQVGWKVGLTSHAIQEQVGVHEPVFGCLLSEGRIATGHVFRYGQLISPGFENEVCVVLSRDLAGSDLPLEEVA